jgi:hypothetical protein
MKQLYFLMTLLTCVGYAQNTSTDNFYPLGDFETDFTQFFNTNGSNLTATEETSEINPHTGSTKSVKLVTAAGLSGTQAAVFKPKAGNQVLGGGDLGNYQFSFWAKSAVAGQKIQARFVAEGGIYVKTNLMTFTDTDWHKVSFNRSDVPANKALQFQIVFIGSDMAGQTFYIDDIMVSMSQRDTDMELSYYDIFRGAPSPVNVPATGLDVTLWAIQNFDGTNQVASFGYTEDQYVSGRRSLKVTTNANTTSEKKGAIQPKDNGTQEIRFTTPQLPSVGGNSDVTIYPEIKYTFSVKVRSNIQDAALNVNYKIAGVSKFGALTTLDANQWSTFTVSHIVDREVITGNTQWQHLPVVQMNTPNAEYYFDDFNFSWEEWNSATAGIDEIESNLVKVYPNPADQFIMLDGIIETASVDLFNITGQRVKSFSVLKSGEQMDISDLNPGVYFARVNETKAIKFIKK